MKIKGLKIPAIIIVIGLLAAIGVCLLSGIVKAPVVTEQDFHYSVTYKLNGEVKTLEGVYTCRFVGYGGASAPRDRVYRGEYADYGLVEHTYAYTIAQENGYDLCIVTPFNDAYLMNDTAHEYYEPSLENPSLSVYDGEGAEYDEAEMLGMFDVEILSWEYPLPVENAFVFTGFSALHTESMLWMLLVGLAVVGACLIFVKKDASIPQTALDRASIALNYVVLFAAIPFLTVVIAFLQLTMSGVAYQIFLCIPAFTAFTLAASIALRRKGFATVGFAVQCVGPAFFVLYAIVETVITNLFF